MQLHIRASWRFSLFLVGGGRGMRYMGWGTLLKIIICIQSGTLLGNIWG